MTLNDLNQPPFTHLPINGGDKFDLMCEFLIPRLKRLFAAYDTIAKHTEKITVSGDLVQQQIYLMNLNNLSQIMHN